MAESKISKSLDGTMSALNSAIVDLRNHSALEAYTASIKSWASGQNHAENTSTVTVTKTGVYLVRMGIRICGASNSDGTGAAYVSVYRNGNKLAFNGNVSNMAIAIPKAWDNHLLITQLSEFNAGDTVYMNVYHGMNVASDSAYPSQCFLRLDRLTVNN